MWEKAIAFVLEREGGYENDPNDPGLETKFGISKRSYPNEDIQALRVERAMEIYKRDYWNICSCDKLPPSIALLVFDTAVNQGTDISIRLLQLAAGVQVDGVIGPNTLMTAKLKEKELPMEFTVRRIVRYGNTKNYSIYGLGWVRRAMACYEAAKG